MRHTKNYMAFSNTLNMVMPVILGIRFRLPEVVNYLNARIKKTENVRTRLNYPILKEHRQATPTMGEYGLKNMDDLTNTSKAQSIFEEENDVKNDVKKVVYDYFWYDIPLINGKSIEGNKFMTELQENCV